MSGKPTIFLGSSSEAKKHAEIIQSLLFEFDAEVKAWWSNEAFPASHTFIESLFDLARATDASLLIASEDDKVTKRGKSEFAPRDNVMFEHGLFAGAHGRARAAIATLGAPELPTDLLGVVVLPLESATSLGSFKEHNRELIRKWVEQLTHQATIPKHCGFAELPKRETLVSFMQEMDGIWDDFDAGWNRIARQDHVAERNFAIALDEFFQAYHHVFSELVRNPETNQSVAGLVTQAVTEAKKCLLIAWVHVAEGKMRLAEDMTNDPPLKGQLRPFKDLYERAERHLLQGRRAKSKNRYDELVKAVGLAEEYMAKANTPTG